ncbi:MAG: cytochrome c3 family protein [Desulfurivibrionaceae bacterium]
MKKKLCVVAMMSALILGGCGQNEKKAEAPPPETMVTVEQAGKTTERTASAVQEKAVATTAKVREKAAVVGEKGKQVAAEIKTAAEKVAAESLVIANRNGKVVLSHGKHAKAHGCAACHGDQKPGPLTLGKDAAHALCLGCHKKKQAGPTGCTQCHQKKGQATEGC